MKKEIPLSRSPSLKNLLGGGDWELRRYSFCAFSVVEKAQRGVLLARACLKPGFLAAKWLLCGILARLLRSRICGVISFNWGFTGFQEIVL